MKKLLFTLIAVFATSTVSAQGAATAEVSRLKAEIRHLEAQINKNVRELGTLKERLALASTQEYIDNKNSETKTLGELRAERNAPRRTSRTTSSL